MMTRYIMLTIISLLIINTAIFVFVLVKKIITNRINDKKTVIKNTYEEQLVRFITSDEHNIEIRPETYLEKKVWETLLLDYNAYIPASKHAALLDRIGKDEILNKIKDDLMSSNVWKKKTGTFLAGEHELQTLAPILLEQLQTPDNQLLFVTAKSLLKIGESDYVKPVLTEVTQDGRMEKNQVMTLLELVQDDISGVLTDCMSSDNVFLKAVALEEMGKRQYPQSVVWIEKALAQPQKEIKIAALKAAFRIGDNGDADYISALFSVKNDEEWEVRAFLAKVLRKINTKESAEILSSFMSDSNWFVRHNAANSLLLLGAFGKSVLNELISADDRFAKEAAKAVLQREELVI